MEKIFTQPIVLVVGDSVQQTTVKDILAQSEKTLLYFYPKNDTPGCTLENTDFTSLKSDFQSL